MKTTFLQPEIQQFISENLNTDTKQLIFKKSPFENVSMQEIVNQIICKKKAKTKIPIWFEKENIIFPNKLNLEQSSSEKTAEYKANLVSGNSIIDLTGGFGIDCFYFSKRCKNVFHCELNSELSEIVTHNFKVLEATNIKTVNQDSLEYLKNAEKFDWIYIDPSRRNDAKGKVFLLADCLPNVPENLDLLFEHSDKVLIKTSPILDIQSAINELQFVTEIHIVALENEVKELLFILEKKESFLEIKTINITKKGNEYFNFNWEEETIPTFELPKKYLYEPNAAILKAGGFKQISEQLSLDKLHQNSHLYTSDELIDFPGRKFEISQIVPYQKKILKKLLPEKKANITTRNFPETVAQIRKKTGIKDGGNTYLFFTTDINDKPCILVCKKIS
ncbi:THUMP-like domain-containing protein [Aureivirga marina]|uniref:THUMP-like domain-containing protein n=1 Tax=Aureivirga marina TaxID=1182451 RepID=UPI0018CB2F49|nr:RsmD family RNA methyltransferase [Aureivirga marina]